MNKHSASPPVSQKMLEHYSAMLDAWSPLEMLRWAEDQYGSKLTFATGFGPEGCVLIDLIGRHNLSVDIFTLDTGVLFPETYILWEQLKARYAIDIRAVKPQLSISEQAGKYGDSLWERKPENCCEMRKVAPLKQALEGVDAWVTAIRRDQTPQRADAGIVEWDTKFKIAKINPLVRWNKHDVWTHIQKHDVPYNPLHDLGYPSIGCQPCTSQVKEGEDDRAGRWRGISKTESGLHGHSIQLTPASQSN